MYKTALDAMDSLTVHSINEIKSYKKPPQSAVIVVSALCDMFSVKPANWENGRALIMRDKYVKQFCWIFTLQIFSSTQKRIFYFIMSFHTSCKVW